MANNNQQVQGRTWKVLDWNIRGINSDKKWNAFRSKIGETNCDIICPQETKMPSIGNSGGCLTVWQSSKFDGILDFSNEYGLSIKLQSRHTNLD